MRASAEVERFRMALEVIGALAVHDSDQAPGIARQALVVPAGIPSTNGGPLKIKPLPPLAAAVPAEPTEDEPESWTPFDGKPESEDEQPPAAEAPAEGAASDYRPARERVLSAIRDADDWITPEAIRKLAAVPAAAQKRACTALKAEGLIKADGWARQTRYRVAAEPEPEDEAEAVAEVEERADELDVDRAEQDAAAVEEEPAPKRELKPLHPVDQRPQKPIQGPVLEAVRYRAGTIREIATRTKLTGNEVATAMLALKREGEVRSEKRGDRVVWSVS